MRQGSFRGVQAGRLVAQESTIHSTSLTRDGLSQEDQRHLLGEASGENQERREEFHDALLYSWYLHLAWSCLSVGLLTVSFSVDYKLHESNNLICLVFCCVPGA